MLVALLGRLTFRIGMAIPRSRDAEACVPCLARVVTRSQIISVGTAGDLCFDAYAGVSGRRGRPPVPELLVTDLRRIAFGIGVTKDIFGFFWFRFLPKRTTRAGGCDRKCYRNDGGEKLRDHCVSISARSSASDADREMPWSQGPC